MIVAQKDFTGGLNLLSSDTNIGANEYRLLVNARARFGPITPIFKHVELTNAPVGKKHGIFGVGATKLLFVSGQAFYQIEGDTVWKLILGFAMDPTVDTYYCCAVPASFKDFVRKSVANISAPISVTNDFKVNGTPAGVVVQDGITQPWFIEFDIVNQIWLARQLGTYQTWGNVNIDASDREYVPIGKQMIYVSGKLLIVNRDGTQVFQSITGRPLDFMVITDTQGNKLLTETEGGAANVTYGFDFDEINAMVVCNTPDSFWIGTAHNLRIITFDFTRTIYGEPLYNVSAIFNVGVVNQFSLLDTLGDFATIDFDGVKSINAVQSLKFRGRNSIFSLQVAKLFITAAHKPIKQQVTAAIQFDNYLLFNVDTRYGNVTLVYDNLLNKWISIDVTLTHHIKQFAQTEIPTETRIYCITQDNKVWQMFASDRTETAIMRTKSYLRIDQKFGEYDGQTEHKSQLFNALFDKCTFDGQVELLEFVDEQESVASREKKQLRTIISGIPLMKGDVVAPPVIPHNIQRINSPTWNLAYGLNGKKISYLLQWNNDSSLLEYEIITSEKGDKVGDRQKQQVYDKTGR